MSTLQQFLTYLTASESLWALWLPLAAALLLHAKEGRASLRIPFMVALWAWVSVFIGHTLSWWTESGYHVANPFWLALVSWVPRGQISLAQTVTLTFVTTLAIDVIGAFSYGLTHYRTLNRWYEGIGGCGIEDLLLILPALSALTWLALAGYLKLRPRLLGPAL
jgi:hypothetical protein